MEWRFWRRARREHDLNEEIDFDLAAEAEEHVDAGMSREAAIRASRRDFGNVSLVKEITREIWGWGSLERLAQDARYALRSMRRTPAFTSIAVLTLALGIAGNTAIFGVVHAVLLRSLPYKDSGSLFMLWKTVPKANIRTSSTSVPSFGDWTSLSRTFEDMAYYSNDDNNLITDPRRDSEAEITKPAWVSPNFFSLLGASPQLGRTFSEGEAERGERLAVLSNGFWQRRFGGSPGAIGQMLYVGGRDYRIVGIMFREFKFPGADTLFWAPSPSHVKWSDSTQDRSARWLRPRVIGRLKSGVSFNQAEAEMTVIADRLARQYPKENRDSSIKLVPLEVQILGRTVPSLMATLLGAAVFILLLACTNVATLLLVRASTREREVAVRSALGAGRLRIARQMLTESTLLALMGGCLAFPFAAWGIRVLVSLAPPDIPRLDEIGIDTEVLAFTALISVMSGLLFGIVPALGAFRRSPQASLAVTPRTSSADTRARTLRGVLVTAEFAIAVILISGAGLLIRSFLAVQAVHPGFQRDRALVLRIVAGTSQIARQAFDRIRELPGVESAGAINGVITAGVSAAGGLRVVEGRSPEAPEARAPLVWTDVTGDAFRALGVPLLSGRFLGDADGAPTAIPAVLINETLSRRFWGNESPIGRRFKPLGHFNDADDWVTVVGVVKDMHWAGIEHEPIAQVFTYSWSPRRDVVVRTKASDPLTMVAAIRRAVRAIDASAGIQEVITLERKLDDHTSKRRFQSSLMALFSALALLLAGVGIYGLMHYSVAQRTNEIGIRVALGAQAADVQRMVVKEGMKQALLGVGLGLAGALAVARALTGLLFGVRPNDPITYAVAAALLIAVALLACLVPARRAARVDPMTALRCD